MNLKLPRILSPNLGCPIICSLDDPIKTGVEVVIAEPLDAAPGVYGLVAKPSGNGDGHEFDLVLEERRELTEPGLPETFNGVEQTRRQISTTLRASIFAGTARFVRFSARPASALTDVHLRTISLAPRITLYDLVLKQGAEELFRAFHALALRPDADGLRFIHATDLHVALRNDLYQAALKIGEEGAGASAAVSFVNFNRNLRRFIEYANEQADKGELDFVLLLGDLVDFIKHNYSDRDDYGENNWKFLCNILTGAETKGGGTAKNSGIKVPVFTSTGNHDWRFFPYPPAVSAAAYGLDKKSAKALNPFWADDPEELTKKTKEFYQKMIGEGALLSNIMLGGKFLHKLGNWIGSLTPKLRDWFRKLLPPGKVRGNLLDWLLPRMATWQVQVLAPLSASAYAAGSGKLPFLGKLNVSPLELLSLALALASGLINGVITFVKFLVRWRSPDLMALEAGWQALSDYFLLLNPYFNYAFRVGANYFLILDTGFDCLRAQRFWDGGRKKLGPISIKDNILGGSPDSMSFFDANEFYAYSQIAWLEKLLRHISLGEGDGPARIFVGLHTPPINLSPQERRKADAALAGQKEIPLEHGSYDIRYGCINHYLSQFLHQCLGRAEGRPRDRFPQISLVLAGHAHWKLECSLRWDDQGNNPCVYYGDYTGDPAAMRTYLEEPRPLLLQTPAIGPVGGDRYSQNPPHFRLIEIDKNGAVLDARVKNA